MTMIVLTAKILTAINIVLLLVLFTVYIRNFAKIKSSFTLSLIVFVLLFLLHNLTCYYAYLTMSYTELGEIIALILAATQAVAFAFLTWATLK